jgi:sigma-B regulation protein RsbU (phosphoserine phosphatase)
MRRVIRAHFATAVYAMLLPGGQLSYCNAGHNAPILLGQSGIRRLESGGPIVGALEGATFDEEMLQLVPGDLLVAFSDGVTEARNSNGEEFGEDQLLACIERHRALAPTVLVAAVLDMVQQFSAGVGQQDDRTVLVVHYTGTPGRTSS